MRSSIAVGLCSPLIAESPCSHPPWGEVLGMILEDRKRGLPISVACLLPAAEGVMGRGSEWPHLAGCSILQNAASFLLLPPIQVQPRTWMRWVKPCSGTTMLNADFGSDPN